MSTEPLTSKSTTDKGNLEDADGESGENYLRGEIKELLQWFDDESKKHKKLFRRLRYVVFGLTACSSALAGVALAFPTIQTGITVAIILTTAAIGIATSVEGLRKPQELWIHERTTYYALLDLQRELRYQANPALTDAYFVLLQSILGGSREKWGREVATNTTAVAPQGFASPEGPPATSRTDPK